MGTYVLLLSIIVESSCLSLYYIIYRPFSKYIFLLVKEWRHFLVTDTFLTIFFKIKTNGTASWRLNHLVKWFIKMSAEIVATLSPLLPQLKRRRGHFVGRLVKQIGCHGARRAYQLTTPASTAGNSLFRAASCKKTNMPLIETLACLLVVLIICLHIN